MGRVWMKNMVEDLPVIFPERAEQKAAYRLLSNPRISMEHVLEPHFEATADRCRAAPVVLALQDTTALNCCQCQSKIPRFLSSDKPFHSSVSISFP